MQFEAKFDVNSILLNLSKDEVDTSSVLARVCIPPSPPLFLIKSFSNQLHMSKLTLSLVKRSYDTKVDFILSGINIEDCITEDASCKYFVTSSGQHGSQSDHLISISLQSIDKVCCDIFVVYLF